MSLPSTRQRARSFPQFSDLMDRATHSHLVVIDIHEFNDWLGFGLLSESGRECFSLDQSEL